jgi:5-methylcytosine-specific restriction endonuclease McrBC regulatory subunit McrC
MYLNISPSNIIFILAYAFDLKWEYLEKEISETDFQESSFFELLVFVLVMWTNKLRRQGLFRSFLGVEDEIKRIRGKILFIPSMKSNGLSGNTLCCQFDELSFDILENQILLSTLEFCEKELVKRRRNVKGKKRQDDISNLALSAYNLVRLLSSQVSYCPLSIQLFNQLIFHRMNIAYKPILRICRFIYDSAVLAQEGEEKFFDIPENKMSEIFERFLRNYLAEKLKGERIKVNSPMPRSWVVAADELETTVSHMPSIHPDIVIWQKGVPKFVIDAKFYAKAMNINKWWSTGEVVGEEKEERESFKTHSSNLYQIIAYTNYYNCDGLLVYAQTESGSFEELVKINPRYYTDKDSCYRRFGFHTLDLSGDFEGFRTRLDDFVEQISKLASISKM